MPPEAGSHAAPRSGALRAIILAAGLGRRLGDEALKPLVEIRPGMSFLSHQIDSLSPHLRPEELLVVVGHRAEEIRSAFPGIPTLENPDFASSNTARSLGLALRELPPESDVLWMNGDLYFDRSLLTRLLAHRPRQACMLVNRHPADPEAMKYTLAPSGFVSSIRKSNPASEGESLGMHFLPAEERPSLETALEAQPMESYFEDALNDAIKRAGLEIAPVDVGDLLCMEVDTPADLAELRRRLHANS